MRRILTITFSLLLLIGFKNVSALEEDIYITNSKGVGITEERFLELMDAGYTLNDIYNMSEEEIDNANTNNPDIAVGIKYYKTTTTTRYGNTTHETTEVTEEEYNNSEEYNNLIRAYGEVNTSYKKLYASVNPSTEYTGKMTYRVYMHWKTMPVVRSYDIIGMGFDSTKVSLSFGPFFTSLYTVNGYTYTSQSCYMKEFSNGAGAVFDLHDTATTLNQELTFEVNKAISNVTVQDTAGDYAHAVETVSGSTVNNNYSAGTIGLSLYNAINSKYDDMSAAQVHWTGTW